jgi:hypothetical protein
MMEIGMDSQVSRRCQCDAPGAEIDRNSLVETAAMPDPGRLFSASLCGFYRVYPNSLSLCGPTERGDAGCQMIEAAMDVGLAAAVKALHDQLAARRVSQS